MKIRAIIIIFLTGQILAFSMDKQLETEYYYKLNFMKHAGPPRQLEMIKAENTGSGRPVFMRGLLFTYKNREARKVAIAGNFSLWKPELMDRNKNGIWYYFLGEYSGRAEVDYKFNVDGIWISDPENVRKEDDGMGSYVSLADPVFTGEGKNVTYRQIDRQTIEFRVYMPEARMISIVGDFNNWNPENDIMNKDNSGIWRLKKRLTPGVYRYKLIVDGKWRPDLYNSDSASDATGDVCSIISVK
jgi:1,4-alpha-glucan branching enzyme